MIATVRRFVSPRDYYIEEFGKSALSLNQLCPFHADSKPSFKVFDPKDGACKCHASTCGRGFPHHLAYHRARHPEFKSDAAAAVDMWEKFIQPFVPEERIQILEAELVANPKVKALLIKERGFNDETIKKFRLGYDPHNNRIAIPVFISRTHCIGFRYWLPRAFRKDDASPKIYHDKGLPHILFNGWQVERDFPPKLTVFFMSSEMDAVRAAQDGYLAVSGMFGEGTFDERWAATFAGRNVVVCLGKDHPAAAEKVRTALLLADVASCRVVSWPSVDGSDAKDYTEFCNEGSVDSAFLRKFEVATQDAVSTVETQTVELIPFHRLTLPENLNKRVKSRAMVCGAGYEHYIVPTKFRVEYDGHEAEITIPTHRELMHFMGKSENAWNAYCRKQLFIAAKIKDVKVTPLDPVDVYQCFLSPDVTGEDRSRYVQHKAFSVGLRPDSNCRYEITATPVTDPSTQIAVLLIDEMSNIGAQNQSITDEEYTALRKALAPIQCASSSELKDRMGRLVENLAGRVTGIVGRPDLHMAALLTWLSPLHFTMEDRVQARGWLQTLILGDSRTGKSEMANHMCRLFQAGEVVSSENCSYVGLIGGLQKHGEQFILVWGRVPRNNEGLLVVEEFSSMSIDDIGRITDVRSSGVAKLDKGGMSNEAMAKTRLIFLSNPRGGISMSRHPDGVRAVQKLIGGAEDIARFDIIMAMAAGEVNAEQIHAEKAKGNQHIKPMIEDWVWPVLISHVWAMPKTQVRLSKKAEEKCREIAERLAKKFHYEVPIFKAEDGRYKLARLACAAAVFTHLPEHRSQKIVVQSYHVEFAAEFLERIWCSPALSYDVWSKSYLESEVKDVSRLQATIRKYTGDGQPYLQFCAMFAEHECFSVDDLSECAVVDRSTAARFAQDLFGQGVIHKQTDPTFNTPNPKIRWNITPHFRKFLVQSKTKESKPSATVSKTIPPNSSSSPKASQPPAPAVVPSVVVTRPAPVALSPAKDAPRSVFGAKVITHIR